MSISLQYRIRNERMHLDPPRRVEVPLEPSQLEALVEDGYIVRENLLDSRLLQTLCEAADEIEAQELAKREANTAGGFGGLFVRNVLDRHPAFLDLLHFEPLLGVARAVLGPQVQVRASVLRVSYPDLPNQQVEWHFHQRCVPDPLPPFFTRPVVLDHLIYLDDLTLESGPLVVLPGSHKFNGDIPTGDHSDKPGQKTVLVPAGSCVTSHSGLWHKAMPTRPGGGKRRLLIWGHGPVWIKQIDKPSNGAGYGLTDTLVEGADEATRELLGLSGFY